MEIQVLLALSGIFYLDL